ncbi:hypothetical protein DXG01_017126 [Tephrocybe rancida]|nr:hypothetical protein DXG01_017126 [Tephrocybe rancida]
MNRIETLLENKADYQKLLASKGRNAQKLLDMFQRTNILVNLGRACLSSVSDKEILALTSYSSAASKGGTVRWQAPELFDPEGDEEKHNSNASDIYAWACIGYEVRELLYTSTIPMTE